MLKKIQNEEAYRDASTIWDSMIETFPNAPKNWLEDFVLVKREQTEQVIKDLDRLRTFPKLLTSAEILEIEGRISGYFNNPKVNLWYLH